MVETVSRPVVGVSPRRAIVFGVVAVGFLLAGVYVGRLSATPGAYRAVLPALFFLIVLTLVTGIQAYHNGSTVHAVGLILAGPFGGYLSTYSPLELPVVSMLFDFPLTVAFLFGGLGHLVGSQVADDHDAIGDPGIVGQILVATTMGVLLVRQIFDACGRV